MNLIRFCVVPKSWIAALVLVPVGFPQFICAQTAGAQVVANTNSNLLPQVRAYLEKQVAAMKLVRFEFTVMQAHALNKVNSETKYFVYFDGNQFYERKSILGAKNVAGAEAEKSFNGEILYMGSLMDPSARFPAFLTKYLVSDSTDPQRTALMCEFPYLDAAGLYAPKWIAEMQHFVSVESLVLRNLNQSSLTKIEKDGGNIRITVQIPDPELMRVRGINIEQRQKELESWHRPPEEIKHIIGTLERMQKLEPTREVTFVLDAKYGYASVEREENSLDGKRLLRVQSEDWKYYNAQDIWLPNRSIVSYYGNYADDKFSDQPTLTATVSLNSIAFTRTNIQFSLDYKQRGTLVTDRTSPESRTRPDHQITYTVAADGKLLRDSADVVAPQINRSKRIVWICIFLVLLGLPAAVFLIQLRKKAS